jgi:ABC-type polysaccharide/polyol phosphate transport system ATPase subunit
MGFSKKEIDRKVNDIIDFAEIRDFIHQPLRSYSTGMIARLGFAIMTEVDPDIMVVDEVLSVGDEHFRKKCEERLRDFKGRGVTIFLVSHWMEEIEAVCDEVLWLENGSMRMCGEPRAVIGEYLKTV